MITLVAIMLNEAGYVGRWIAHYHRYRELFKEALVVDGGSTDDTVAQLRAGGVRVIEHRFADDFSEQRNLALAACSTSWVFELDADELLAAPLAAGLTQVSYDAHTANVDCVGVPRLNFIDGRLTAGPGHAGLDFQYRLHRQHCRWEKRVHEEISNYRARIELEVAAGHFILHDKDSGRHNERNAYYGTLQP